MNLVLIDTDKSFNGKREGLRKSKYMIKIKDEYPVERIMRIARINGIEKVFCVINSHEKEFKHYLSSKEFGIPLKLFVHDAENSLLNLFVVAPFLKNVSFLLVTMDMVFIENEFSEFIAYSKLQENADGVLAVTRYFDDKEPLCVAMNDEDIILKFSDSRDGYSWATGGIYYFLPDVLNEIEYASQTGISGLSKSLQLLIAKRYILKGFSFTKIIKVKNTDDIAKAEKLIKENYNV